MISTVGATATLKPFDLSSTRPTLALKYVVPRPPAAPDGSLLPTTLGIFAPTCSRGASPIATSTIGKSTSLTSVPAQRMRETPNHIPPGVKRLASSIHANGVAPLDRSSEVGDGS